MLKATLRQPKQLPFLGLRKQHTVPKKTSEEPKMDPKTFKTAAYTAIDESMSLASQPLQSHIHNTRPTYHASYLLFYQHFRSTGHSVYQARLSQATTSRHCPSRTTTIHLLHGRHQEIHHARSNTLATSAVHGFLPCFSFLPLNTRRTIFSRLHRTGIQLAMFTRLY